MQYSRIQWAIRFPFTENCGLLLLYNTTRTLSGPQGDPPNMPTRRDAPRRRGSRDRR
jgi:hypothetical protein